MLRAIKIKLKPTKEQEILFWKSAGTSRWAYNYYLSENERVYHEYLVNGETGSKSISEGAVRKHINNELKPTTHTWLKEVSSNVMKQAIKDADNALKRFFKGISGKPKYKSKHRSKPSFYVNYESLKRVQNGFQGEKLGVIKTTKPLPKLKKGEHYSNPRISYDGKYWYLSVGYEVSAVECELTGESLGIDLGVKELATVSNGMVYKNINKTKRVRSLEKRLKREQRKFSRMLINNTQSYDVKRRPIWKRPLKDCKNVQRQNAKIRLIHKRLTDIRNDYTHQTTTEIVKTKPSRIVMESLNVKGMLKNKHLAKAISQQRFYEFIRQMKYKCETFGIKFVQADKFYPSSKMCSCCGNVKKDLKLSDRVYRCDACGYVADRDFNASINLANYQLA
jgi:putative transposase